MHRGRGNGEFHAGYSLNLWNDLSYALKEHYIRDNKSDDNYISMMK